MKFIQNIFFICSPHCSNRCVTCNSTICGTAHTITKHCEYILFVAAHIGAILLLRASAHVRPCRNVVLEIGG